VVVSLFLHKQDCLSFDSNILYIKFHYISNTHKTIFRFLVVLGQFCTFRDFFGHFCQKFLRTKPTKFLFWYFVSFVDKQNSFQISFRFGSLINIPISPMAAIRPY